MLEIRNLDFQRIHRRFVLVKFGSTCREDRDTGSREDKKGLEGCAIGFSCLLLDR